MLGEVRYQVFLSSTYVDLRVERQQATQTILEMGHMPAGMELFPASDLSQWELIKRVIDESDYYVIIVGARYGSVNRETGLSFTEMEYDYAASIGIPILGFVRRDITSVAVKDSEQNEDNKKKLEAFRNKVLQRICRQYDDASELGMLVMKSLMSETRTNPRTGWVRADQARGKEDIEREQTLLDEITQRDRTIKRLERKIRDRTIPLSGLSRTDMSQGDDIYPLTVHFQDRHKRLMSQDVPLSWDEIFSVIGPAMYGYILRRADRGYGPHAGRYSFEDNLVAYIRSKILEECGNRQINLLPHQVDTVLIQFKQLGLMAYTEKTDEEAGKNFRGYTLTVAGEEYLTKIKTNLR